MGPVLRARATLDSSRTGLESANSMNKKSKVLANKTNHMVVRRSTRSVSSPQPNLGSQQKPCIYKVGNTAENQDLPPEERLALYTFKVDESDPQPKKSKRRRKVKHRKKMDVSDTVDVEYAPSINVKKRLRPGTRLIVTRQKKQPSTGVTSCGKMTLSNEETVPAADSSLKCQNTGGAHCEKLVLWNEDTVAVADNSLKCLSPGAVCHDSNSHRKTATENKENIALADAISTCQVVSVICNEPRNLVTENRAALSAAAGTNLAEESQLNFSVANSERGRISTSRSSGLPSPIVQHFAQGVTMRRPGKRKHTRGIQSVQSVEDFTIDNCFGFDEECEDDPHFLLPQVETVPSGKAVVSVPFAITSTPNPKPSFTISETKPLRLLQAEPRRTMAVPVQSAAVPTVQSAAVPTAPSPSIIYVDENVQHFTKPPRRSYERALRLYRESNSEEGLSDEEACGRKRSKRTKKARMQEEKRLNRWAASVSAEFSEIDSFSLCVE